MVRPYPHTLSGVMPLHCESSAKALHSRHLGLIYKGQSKALVRPYVRPYKGLTKALTKGGATIFGAPAARKKPSTVSERTRACAAHT